MEHSPGAQTNPAAPQHEERTACDSTSSNVRPQTKKVDSNAITVIPMLTPQMSSASTTCSSEYLTPASFHRGASSDLALSRRSRTQEELATEEMFLNLMSNNVLAIGESEDESPVIARPILSHLRATVSPTDHGQSDFQLSSGSHTTRARMTQSEHPTSSHHQTSTHFAPEHTSNPSPAPQHHRPVLRTMSTLSDSDWPVVDSTNHNVEFAFQSTSVGLPAYVDARSRVEEDAEMPDGSSEQATSPLPPQPKFWTLSTSMADSMIADAQLPCSILQEPLFTQRRSSIFSRNPFRPLDRGEIGVLHEYMFGVEAPEERLHSWRIFDSLEGV